MGTVAVGQRRVDPAPTAERTVIRPPGRWTGLGLREFWRLRAICLVLTRRNLMVRYRQTLVGASWALLQPILLMIVFTVFFGLVVRVPTEGLAYPVFLFIGLVIWQMVSKIITEGSTSIVNNAPLVTHVYFPRAYFPVSVAIASLVDLVLSTAALAILLLTFNTIPGPALLLAPIFVAIAWITGLGVTFWLSSINVAYRDVTQLLPFIAQLWMFGSPIIYPSTLITEPFRTLFFLNPLALSIEGMRWAVAGTPLPGPAAWVLSTVMALFILLTGYAFFRKREPTFSDVV